MIRVLFVCTGNLCRSPMALGAFRTLLRAYGLERDIEADSAGTHAVCAGSPPDPRGCAAARRREIDIPPVPARRITMRDVEAADHIIAMDEDNVRDLERIAAPAHRRKIRLLLDYAPAFAHERDIPDPYYDVDDGFERVLDRIEAGVYGLLRVICRDREIPFSNA